MVLGRWPWQRRRGGVPVFAFVWWRDETDALGLRLMLMQMVAATVAAPPSAVELLIPTTALVAVGNALVWFFGVARKDAVREEQERVAKATYAELRTDFEEFKQQAALDRQTILTAVASVRSLANRLEQAITGLNGNNGLIGDMKDLRLQLGSMSDKIASLQIALSSAVSQTRRIRP